uniref:Uncharacterized protein n=1 Tax=Toxoplasma gondii COUG TaxID=1074873 RepID=A0A2G8XTI4_TOXGO|nr:hypothetical protein TGCOUG_311490 [Toxoplasma gondii COUG]
MSKLAKKCVCTPPSFIFPRRPRAQARGTEQPGPWGRRELVLNTREDLADATKRDCVSVLRSSSVVALRAIFQGLEDGQATTPTEGHTHNPLATPKPTQALRALEEPGRNTVDHALDDMDSALDPVNSKFESDNVEPEVAELISNVMHRVELGKVPHSSKLLRPQTRPPAPIPFIFGKPENSFRPIEPAPVSGAEGLYSELGSGGEDEFMSTSARTAFDVPVRNAVPFPSVLPGDSIVSPLPPAVVPSLKATQPLTVWTPSLVAAQREKRTSASDRTRHSRNGPEESREKQRAEDRTEEPRRRKAMQSPPGEVPEAEVEEGRTRTQQSDTEASKRGRKKARGRRRKKDKDKEDSQGAADVGNSESAPQTLMRTSQVEKRNRNEETRAGALDNRRYPAGVAEPRRDKKGEVEETEEPRRKTARDANAILSAREAEKKKRRKERKRNNQRRHAAEPSLTSPQDKRDDAEKRQKTNSERNERAIAVPQNSKLGVQRYVATERGRSPKPGKRLPVVEEKKGANSRNDENKAEDQPAVSPLVDDGPGHKNERKGTAARLAPRQASSLHRKTDDKGKPQTTQDPLGETAAAGATAEGAEDQKRRASRQRRGVATTLDLKSPSMSVSGPSGAPSFVAGIWRRRRTGPWLSGLTDVDEVEAEVPGPELDSSEAYSGAAGHTHSGDSVEATRVDAMKDSHRPSFRRPVLMRFSVPLPTPPPAPPPTPMTPLSPKSPRASLSPRTSKTQSKHLPSVTQSPFMWKETSEDFDRDKLEVVPLPRDWWDTLVPHLPYGKDDETLSPSRVTDDGAVDLRDSAAPSKWDSSGALEGVDAASRKKRRDSEEDARPWRRPSVVAVPPDLPLPSGSDAEPGLRLASLLQNVKKALGADDDEKDQMHRDGEADNQAEEQISKSRQALLDSMNALSAGRTQKTAGEEDGENYGKETHLEDYGNATDDLPAGRLSLLLLGVVCAVSRVGFDLRKRKKRERQRRAGRMVWRSRFQSKTDFSMSRANSLDTSFPSLSRTVMPGSLSRSTLSSLTPNAFDGSPRKGGDSDSTVSTGFSRVSSSVSSSSADSIPLSMGSTHDRKRKKGARHAFRRGCRRQRRPVQGQVYAGESRLRTPAKKPDSLYTQAGEPEKTVCTGVPCGKALPAALSVRGSNGNEDATERGLAGGPSLVSSVQPVETGAADTAPGLPDQQSKQTRGTRKGRSSVARGLRRRSVTARPRRRHRQRQEVAAKLPAAGPSDTFRAEGEVSPDSRNGLSFYDNAGFTPFQGTPEHSRKLDLIVNTSVGGKNV